VATHSEQNAIKYPALGKKIETSGNISLTVSSETCRFVNNVSNIKFKISFFVWCKNIFDITSNVEKKEKGKEKEIKRKLVK
jgi:hypothetical protein